MSMWKQKATTSSGDFEKAPLGNHPAALVALVDLGMQEETYQGETKTQHKCYLVWELVTEKRANGDNHVIGVTLTFSMNEKAKLRQWLESWRGKKMAEGEEFDFSTLPGKKCLLSVTEKNGYPVVSGVGSIPKGMTVAAPTKTPVLFSASDDLDTLPDWLPYIYGKRVKDVIEARVDDRTELVGAGSTATNTLGEADDAPF